MLKNLILLPLTTSLTYWSYCERRALQVSYVQTLMAFPTCVSRPSPFPCPKVQCINEGAYKWHLPANSDIWWGLCSLRDGRWELFHISNNMHLKKKNKQTVTKKPSLLLLEETKFLLLFICLYCSTSNFTANSVKTKKLLSIYSYLADNISADIIYGLQFTM